MTISIRYVQKGIQRTIADMLLTRFIAQVTPHPLSSHTAVHATPAMLDGRGMEQVKLTKSHAWRTTRRCCTQRTMGLDPQLWP